MISIIAAVSENNVIGNSGKIPWYLPRDFKHFKETTLGHPIVMGRKTYESIGKALLGRENIILTRQDVHIEGCTVINSTKDILKRSEKEKLFIIGGSNIYEQFLPYTDELILTRVKTMVDGDTFFPDIKIDEWKLTSSETYTKDEKNKFDMIIEKYERK